MSAKPTQLPGHFRLFGSQVRSYRDLPLRFYDKTRRCIATRRPASCPPVICSFRRMTPTALLRARTGGGVGVAAAVGERVYGDFGLPFAAKLGTRPAEFLGEIETLASASAQLKGCVSSRGGDASGGDGA